MHQLSFVGIKEKESSVLLRVALPTADQTRQGKKRKKVGKEREKYKQINDLLWLKDGINSSRIDGMSFLMN